MPNLDRRTFTLARRVLTRYAEAHPVHLAPTLQARTCRGAPDPLQLKQRPGAVSSLGALNAAEQEAIAERLNEAVGATEFSTTAVQALLDAWLQLEKRHGWAADDADILALAGAHPANNPADVRRFVALCIMLHGSKKMSRTVTFAVPYTRVVAPMSATEMNRVAARNFERAARCVVTHAETLPLTFATAAKLNFVLSQDIVPRLAGRLMPHARQDATVYSWLGSEEATRMLTHDPIGLAERVHFEGSLGDHFVDGNGRTARLLADLILLKSGSAPAYYTDIDHYFRHGSCRASVERQRKEQYFRRIAARGEALVKRACLQCVQSAPPDVRPKI